MWLHGALSAREGRDLTHVPWSSGQGPCFCPEHLLCSSPAAPAVPPARQCWTSALEPSSCPPRSGPTLGCVTGSLPEAKWRLISPSAVQTGCLSSRHPSGQGPLRRRGVSRCLRLVRTSVRPRVYAMGRVTWALFNGAILIWWEPPRPPNPCSPAFRLPCAQISLSVQGRGRGLWRAAAVAGAAPSNTHRLRPSPGREGLLVRPGRPCWSVLGELKTGLEEGIGGASEWKGGLGHGGWSLGWVGGSWVCSELGPALGTTLATLT